LRFLIDPGVPFTNNLAERDLRMMKVRQKISGCFRTATGAENFATLRTVLSTARKQGWSLIQTLQESPDALIAKIKTA
jgi:transposase